ncbi:MAG: putative Ig domain-containing protein [Deltaproteobacteria bacterium]|nr:putative Ig domain-containing protein [Deltaproteobacteria bacterium]
MRTRREVVRLALQLVAGGAALLFAPSLRRAHAQAPVWRTIPDQTWTVGVPVLLDLRAYVSDADGDTLTLSLSRALPPGLTLRDGVISGTPTQELPPAAFVVSADDAQLPDSVPPAAPTGLRVI